MLTVTPTPLAALRPNPGNPKRHALAAIRASLRTFGFQQPLLVDRRTGLLLGCHGRVEALVAMRDAGEHPPTGVAPGPTEAPLDWVVPVVETDTADDAQAHALLVALNRTEELGGWDPIGLEKMLAGMDQALRGVAGFDNAALRTLGEDVDRAMAKLRAEAGIVDDVPAPAPPDDPKSKAGDLWILGSHRLLCGDSGNPADLDRLMAGHPVHLLNTDPPYNVKVEPRSNNAIAAGLSSFSGPQQRHHQALDLARHPGKSKATHKQMRAKDRPLANDFVTDTAFEDLLRAWFGNASRVMLPGASFYIWGGYANVANYPPALIEAEFYFSQTIIWDKQHPVLTRKDFMGAHEWCFYGWKEGAGHKFYGPNNVTDLWHVKKVNPQSMVHLTEKPIELAARAIEYSSRSGENVLDLFGGSGSTLMAAEKTGRRAHLMELDRAYTDVIVSRWEAATGKVAVLEPRP